MFFGCKMEYQVGDVVVTKKKHPCGGDRWVIVRAGADMKIRCETCGHVVMLDYAAFRKSVKKYIPQGEENA